MDTSFLFSCPVVVPLLHIDADVCSRGSFLPVFVPPPGRLSQFHTTRQQPPARASSAVRSVAVHYRWDLKPIHTLLVMYHMQRSAALSMLLLPLSPGYLSLQPHYGHRSVECVLACTLPPLLCQLLLAISFYIYLQDTFVHHSLREEDQEVQWLADRPYLFGYCTCHKVLRTKLVSPHFSSHQSSNHHHIHTITAIEVRSPLESHFITSVRLCRATKRTTMTSNKEHEPSWLDETKE